MMDDSINGGIVDNDTHATTSIQLESIIVYPIKSCAGFSVRVWPLSDCGKLTKPKAILFYQTCLLPFPMAFTFHWNIPNRHTLERCQKCKSLSLKHGYTHVFFSSFEHWNFVEIWCAGLLYDREWLIQNHSGDTLTQKKVSELFASQALNTMYCKKNWTATESALLDYRWKDLFDLGLLFSGIWVLICEWDII